MACCAAFAQPYSISTVAGGAPPNTPVAATGITIGQPRRVTTDSSGSVYFSSDNAVFKIAGGTLALVAGNSRPGFSGDGGAAVNAQLNAPQGLAVDSHGNVYIADSGNNRVRVVTSDGLIHTFAGNGLLGTPRFLGDGGQAVNGNLQQPGGVAVDSTGTVYIADTLDNVIRKVTSDGVISTIAGNFYAGYSGNGNPAFGAAFNHPQDVLLDSSGNIYVADTLNGYVRKITTDGLVNFIAGDGNIGYSGDGGAGTSAGLIEPFSLALDSGGNLYIAERADGRIRKLDSKGNISTVAGTGALGFAGDNGSATAAQLFLPMGVAVDASGNLYIADTGNNRVRKLASGSINTIAGNGGYAYSGDNGAAGKAQLNSPQAAAVDSTGNLYIADTANHVVRKVTAGGTITTFAGNGTPGSTGDNGAPTAAQLNAPAGVAVDGNGNVYIADTANSHVRKVASGGAISTVAGGSGPGYSGDGGSGSSALLSFPTGLAADGAGNLYIADTLNSAIRKLSTSGNITTIAGTGLQGYSGDGNQASAAQLNYPQGVAVDSLGNVYIADTGNNRVRKVTAGGVITTVAGNGLAGYSGDGGPATQAQLANPTGIVVDAAGNLFVSDAGAFVRKIAAGTITTVAGNGTQGYSGDGGVAQNAMLNRPTGLSADAHGNVYLADTGNNAVRLLQPQGGSLAIAAVASNANYAAGVVAPGEVVVIYGSGLGPAKLASYPQGGPVPTQVGGTTVSFNGQAAPVIYSSAGQVAAIVPFGLTGSAAQVTVSYQNATSAPFGVNVATVVPGLLALDGSGKGQAAAINNSDGSINGAAHAANAGSYVQFYGTGFGALSTMPQDGQLASGVDSTVQTVTATVGGKPTNVQYAGAAPGLPYGVTQINVQIPAGLTAGSSAVVLTIGGQSTQSGLTVAVSGN